MKTLYDFVTVKIVVVVVVIIIIIFVKCYRNEM